jgi:acetyltransferase EpsM
VKNSASDESLQVVSILALDGTSVRKDQAVFELEGSKAIFEVLSPTVGIFNALVSEGDSVEVGAILGMISQDRALSPEEINTQLANLGVAEVQAASSRSFSKRALELIESHGLSKGDFEESDYVTEAMVIEKLSESENSNNSLREGVASAGGRVAFLGGGNGATVFLEALLSMRGRPYEVAGVFDDSNNSIKDIGFDTLGGLREAEVYEAWMSGFFDCVVITISGNMQLRKRWLHYCIEKQIPMATIVHANAEIAPSAIVGPGSVVLAMSRVGSHARLGSNDFLSAFVNVDHHSVVGSNSTFGPGVFLSGGVNVGDSCVFGTNIGVEPKLVIGSNAVIASGTSVTLDVPAGQTLKTRGSPLR